MLGIKKELEVCPFCSGDIQKGVIESVCAEDISGDVTNVWYVKDEDKNKLFGKKLVSLELEADGYYCDKCEMYFGVYGRRY